MSTPVDPGPRPLPCPFCGGEADLSRRQDESLWSHAIVWWSRIGCSTCDFGMSECDDEDGKQAIAAWNRRASLSEPGAVEGPTWHRQDKPWSEYPIGTRARDHSHCCWTRVANGWQADGGDTFPTPGASANYIQLPAAPASLSGAPPDVVACPDCGYTDWSTSFESVDAQSHGYGPTSPPPALFDGFIAFIGNGEQSRGRFPTNLSELNDDCREFASSRSSREAPSDSEWRKFATHGYRCGMNRIAPDGIHQCPCDCGLDELEANKQ